MNQLNELLDNPKLLAGYTVSWARSEINRERYMCQNDAKRIVAQLDKLTIAGTEHWFLFVRNQIEDRGQEKIYSEKEIKLDGSFDQLKQELDKL